MLLVSSLYISIVGTGTAAEPIIKEITLDPEEPSPLSTITFTAVINNSNNLDDVRLIVQECTDSLCYAIGSNESMLAVDNNTYQTTVTLTHNDATYIKYHLEIETNETWYIYSITELNLKNETNNNSSNNNNNNTNPSNGNTSEKTPGFEILPFLMSIIFVTIIATLSERKRL